MATLIIAQIVDDLVSALDAARIASAGDQRWLNALNTGASWLLQQDSIEFNIERHELTVNSPSGKTYHANGACQCEAFQSHQACWHRAGARLCRRAIEAQQLQAELQRTSVAARLARARAAVDVLWA